MASDPLNAHGSRGGSVLPKIARWNGAGLIRGATGLRRASGDGRGLFNAKKEVVHKTNTFSIAISEVITKQRD